MEINGIEVHNIKDAQDILTALETIRNGIEILSEEMGRNYQDYSDIANSFDENTTAQKGLIDSISNLQMKAVGLYDNYLSLNDEQRQINSSNIRNLQQASNDFDRQIKDTMSNAINNIDLSKFREQIENLFHAKIAKLEDEVKKLTTNNDKLNYLNNEIDIRLNSIKNTVEIDLNTIKNNIDSQLNSTKNSINTTLSSVKNNMIDSIDDFNRLSKAMNWKIIVSVGLSSMIIGGMIVAGLGWFLFKHKIF